MHKTQLHFSPMYTAWNTLLNGYKQGAVASSKRKPLPRSTAHSSQYLYLKIHGYRSNTKYLQQFQTLSLCDWPNMAGHCGFTHSGHLAYNRSTTTHSAPRHSIHNSDALNC